MLIDQQIQAGNYYYTRIITLCLPYPWMYLGWTMLPSGAYKKLTKGSKRQSSFPGKGAKIDVFPQGVSHQGHVYILYKVSGADAHSLGGEPSEEKCQSSLNI